MNNAVIIQENNYLHNEISEELFAQYIRYLDTSQKTVETYTRALRQFFKYLNLNNIRQPQRADILNYKESLKASGLKPSTIQSYITAVRIFFSWTAQERLYPNIAERIKGAKLDRTHKKDSLTSAQVKAVINGIERTTEQGLRDYAILSLMVTGGLRDIEISRANIEDLRTAGENIVLYVQGKGHEEKADYVKIPGPTERAIRDYLKQRKTSSEKDPLFTSTSNNSKGKRLSTRSISGIAKSHLKAAGYNSTRLTAHSFRHTAVTLAILSGQDLTAVQQHARHADFNTTQIYNHSLDKAKNGCAEAIARMIFDY